MEKKLKHYKYGLRALAMYAVISFLWVCVFAIGVTIPNNAVDDFTKRLVVSNIFIAMFSAVYGYSSAVFDAKRLTPGVKRLIHVVVNYIASVACFCALTRNVKDAQLKTWVVAIIAATFVYFVIYGIAVLIKMIRNN